MELSREPEGGEYPISVTESGQRLLALLEHHTGPERQILQNAAQWAVEAHQGQQRVSGEPFFNHALAVAEILDDLKLDYETISAAMLHDVVEDTDIMLDDVQREFGPAIARLVDGVTKM
jgi:GTP pyrophosphokinase